MKKLFAAVLFAAAALGAQDVPVVIAGGPDTGIPLAFKAEKDVKMNHAHWIGVNADRMVISSFPASATWRKGGFTVVPKADGSIRMELKAGHVRKDGKPVPMGYCYDNIRVNGFLIPNGGFEEGPRGFGYYIVPGLEAYRPRIVSDPSAASGGNRYAVAWDLGPVSFRIPVKKDQPVAVSFDYRSAGLIVPEKQQNQFYPLSLAGVANMGYADEVPGDGKGGWTDQGRSNDLRAFIPKTKKYGGIPFAVLDPEKNGGKSCVILKSSHSAFGAEEIRLPVGELCSGIDMLSSAAWGKKSEHAGDLTVVFEDGKSKTFPLIMGKNIGEWWQPVRTLPDGELAWSGTNSHNIIGLYRTSFPLGGEKRVREVVIRPTKENTAALGIVGLTASLIRRQDTDAADRVQFKVPLKEKSKLIALPVETVQLEMRKLGLPADDFFDELKRLSRVQAFDPEGRELPLAVAKYSRRLAPVLLVRSDRPVDSVTLKCGREDKTRIMSPASAVRRIAGEKRVAVNDTSWANGVMLLPRGADLKNAKLIRDEDSVYQEMISFEPENSEAVFTFELAKTAKVKLFACMRHPGKSQSNRIRATFDGKPFVIVGGVYYKQINSCYWTGGERIELSAGRHTLKLVIPGKKEDRKGLSVAKFYLGFDVHAPEPSGFSDELAGLRALGFTVAGDGEDVKLADIPSKDRIHRIVNPDVSYPDLSSLVQNQIDRRGALHADGSSMRFDDGTELPFIWGRNISAGMFYEMWKENRLGGPGSEDLLMKRLKSLGISSIRYFFSTMPRALWTNINNVPMFLLAGNRDPLTYDPEFLELHQRMIAAAHKHGIYIKLTFGAYPWSFRPVSQEKQSMFYHPFLIELQKRRMNLLLNTPNPYRNGIRPAEDPTIAIVEIENECNFRGGGFGNRDSWHKLGDADRNVLYPVWQEFLKQKYKTVGALKKQWGFLPLRKGKTEELFENIDFVDTGDAAKWGNDNSDFKVEMDDLRVTSASFGKEKRSNPAVSDGFEFMYKIYSDYLKTMYAHLRSIGFRGIITACGPDTENYYNQRAAANAVLDAVSGGTGYWNRNGYGFIRSLSWLNPMIYAAAPDKPVISREYGANLANENSWWGNVICAAVQKAMGKAYLYDFASSVPGPDITPDYLYPDDAHEQRSVDLLHEMHLYCTIANTAAAIAVRSDELKKPEFKLDIAYPLDNVFYAAPFRGYNKMTIDDFVPFLYTDSNVRTFAGAYDGNADLVVNEPSIPAGNYSRAKHLFAVRPHASFDRFGKPVSGWFKGKNFSADGFLDTRAEKLALYDAIVKAGGRMSVSREEFCKVWRDSGRRLEIDTVKATFRGDTSTWGAFIGELSAAKEKAPRFYTPEGAGSAWTFFGKIPEYDLFFGIMNGKVRLHDTARLRYVMLGSSSLDLNTEQNVKLVSLRSGSPVNMALKTNAENLAGAKKIMVTFFRSKSCQLPAEVSFGRKIVSVRACGRDGVVLADIPHTEYSFRNLWRQGHLISYYEVELQ